MGVGKKRKLSGIKLFAFVLSSLGGRKVSNMIAISPQSKNYFMNHVHVIIFLSFFFHLPTRNILLTQKTSYLKIPQLAFNFIPHEDGIN